MIARRCLLAALVALAAVSPAPAQTGAPEVPAVRCGRLVDAHTHLLEDYDPAFGGDDLNVTLTVARMSTAERALLGAKLGREALEAGFTTVRDLGNIRDLE